MNKYSPGQTLYNLNADAFFTIRQGIVYGIFKDAGVYQYNMLWADFNTTTVAESDLTDNVTLAEDFFRNNYGDAIFIPTTPLKIGQTVFVVLNQNIRLNTDQGLSIQIGTIVACTNYNGKNQYLIQLQNATNNQTGLTNNQNQVWVSETQLNSQDGGVSGVNFFLSYNLAAQFYQLMTSLLLQWRLVWLLDIEGIITSGYIDVLGGTTVDNSIDFTATPFDTGAYMSFYIMPINRMAPVTNIEFPTFFRWNVTLNNAPLDIPEMESYLVAEAGLESTGGLVDTATVVFKTTFNTLTVNIPYSRT